MKDRINQVKGREEFRPFAPMILKEDADTYFDSEIPSPFMNTIRKAKLETIEKYPSIVHLDALQDYKSDRRTTQNIITRGKRNRMSNVA